MDDERLIIEVENHPVLYDASHPFYKDNSKKDKAWEEIAKTLGFHGEYNQFDSTENVSSILVCGDIS